MQFGGRPGGGLQSEINVTPLVDVVLVLLIIFMVMLPLTLRGYGMDIPAEAAANEAEPAPEQVVLAIDPARCSGIAAPGAAALPADCRVDVDGEETPIAALPERLREIYRDRGADDRVLFLSADDRVNYEGVLRIVDVAKAAVTDLEIGFVTR
jgi:biopolymer transport protein ExbD